MLSSFHLIDITSCTIIMSYLALARSWRPKFFSDVVGQQHVLKALSNALSLGRVHHAYLFSGTRGVGKTSIARLLAKGLNCEKGVTATPCGECQSCLDIEQNRCVDLIEIDAASRTKVEDTREILDNVQYLPVRSRYKIYLIDEVHMLSRSSFNALLKTLEEPPEHVKFLLATTDPQKLPITVLSRCLQFHLRALSDEQIQDQLSHVLTQEKIAFQDKALHLLAKAAEGSLRDALSLTEQAIASGNGQIDTESVSQMLGLLDDHYALTLIEQLHKLQSQSVMETLNQIASLGVDWDSVLADVLSLLHRIAMLQLLPSSHSENNYQQRLHALTSQIKPEDVQLYYQILLMARKELAFAPNRRMGTEMAFLRALVFQPSAEPSMPVASVKTAAVQNTQSVMPESDDHNQTIASSFTTKVREEPASVLSQSHTQITKSESAQVKQTTASSLTEKLLKAREQLSQGDASSKKSDAAVALLMPHTNKKENSVLDRFLATAEQKTKSQHVAPTVELEDDNEQRYQWQFTQPYEMNQPVVQPTPKVLRQALEYEKTPELNAKLTQEAIEQDEWSAMIEQLTLPRLIKLLAMNAYKKDLDAETVQLHVRSSQRHLNTDEAQNILSKALSEYLQHTVKVITLEDDDKTQRTPIEWREWLYAQKLVQAKQSVEQDPIIEKICRFFEAKIDEDSIRPV